MRKVSENFIGTCQACFGEFKVNEKSKRIVFHGYQRPGVGYTIGECGGTGHEPFEYDTKLTVEIIKAHHAMAAKYQHRHDRITAGAITSITRSEKVWSEEAHKNVEVQKTYNEGDKDWDRIKRVTLAKLEGDARWHTRYAGHLQAMVDKWTRGQIIGIDVPATNRERALRRAYDPIEADAMAERAAIIAAREAKPGKLRVLFYQPEFPRPESMPGDAGWRKWYEAMTAQRAKFVADTRQWAKANITGKSLVRGGYDHDLPREVRPTGSFDVVIVNLPWDYRDEITTMFSSAVLIENAPKKRGYVVAGAARPH